MYVTYIDMYIHDQIHHPSAAAKNTALQIAAVRRRSMTVASKDVSHNAILVLKALCKIDAEPLAWEARKTGPWSNKLLDVVGLRAWRLCMECS